MKLYICNAFSLSMLNPEHQLASPHNGAIIGDQMILPRIPVPLSDGADYVWTLVTKGEYKLVSAVGHEDTARLFTELLGEKIQMNRISVKLDDRKDIAVIGQLMGPRLPEGCTTLPPGATIQWWRV